MGVASVEVSDPWKLIPGYSGSDTDTDTDTAESTVCFCSGVPGAPTVVASQVSRAQVQHPKPGLRQTVQLMVACLAVPQVGILLAFIGSIVFVWFAVQPEVDRLKDAWYAVKRGEFSQ